MRFSPSACHSPERTVMLSTPSSHVYFPPQTGLGEGDELTATVPCVLLACESTCARGLRWVSGIRINLAKTSGTKLGNHNFTTPRASHAYSTYTRPPEKHYDAQSAVQQLLLVLITNISHVTPSTIPPPLQNQSNIVTEHMIIQGLMFEFRHWRNRTQAWEF